MPTIDPAVAKVLGELEFRRDSELLISQELARAIHQAIADGRLPPGSHLPATEFVGKIVGTSRQIAQEALGRLADRGLLFRKRKAGTVVVEKRPWFTVSLLTRIDGDMPKPVDLGRRVLRDFIREAEARALGHREYACQPRGGQVRMHPGLRDDLVDDILDLVVAVAVDASLVTDSVRMLKSPVVQLGPEAGVDEALTLAVGWLAQRGAVAPALIQAALPGLPDVRECVQDRARRHGLALSDERVLRPQARLVAEGRRLWHALFGDQSRSPDALIVMDDMVAVGLIEEGGACGRPLDPDRVVALVHKGAGATLPDRCAKLVVHWDRAVGRVLDWFVGHPRSGPGPLPSEMSFLPGAELELLPGLHRPGE